MPGITLEIGTRPLDLAKFQRAQSGMLHTTDYKASIQMSNSTMAVGQVAYPGYPVWFCNFKAGLVGLEGRVYNRDAASTQSSLTLLAQELVAGADAERLVTEWVLEHDGDYIGVVATGETILIFNDPLARLPLYYAATEDTFCAARECKFVVERRGEVAFDPIAWAECMCLEHPFGGRTLFAGVSHLRGGSLLQVRRRSVNISISLSKIFEFNFEQESDPGVSIADQASSIVDKFTEGTRQRALHEDAGTIVVSLSGGQDSRAVAAALVRSNIPLQSASFITSTGRGTSDARIAARIAKELGIPWSQIDIPASTPEQQQRLLVLKDGLNDMDNGSILPFMDKIVERWGRRATYLTGDGGNQLFGTTMHYLVPSVLAGQITGVSQEMAEGLMQLTPGTIRAEHDKLLSSFPEKDPLRRATHFILCERNPRWLFEGEDRSRSFLWQTSPFFSRVFFREVMRIPAHRKEYHRLYREFQTRLSAACSRIPDANYGIPIASAWFVPMLHVRRNIPTFLKQAVGRFVPGNRFHPFQLPADAVSQLEELSQRFSVSASAGRAMLEHLDPDEFIAWSTLVQLEKMWRHRIPTPRSKPVA